MAKTNSFFATVLSCGGGAALFNIQQMRKMRKKRLTAIFACACVCVVFLSACAPAPCTDESFYMNTIITQSLYTKDTQVLAQNNEILREMEHAMSRTIKDSDVSRLNADKKAEVSPDTVAVIEEALKVSKQTNGAFHVALGKVMEVWGFGTDEAHVPTRLELDAIKDTTDDTQICIDGDTVKLGTAQLDLGGAAKGFALDKLAQNIKDHNIESALISIGGSIYARGKKPNGQPYKIGIRDPQGTQSDYLAVIEIDDACISTSGVYERGFVQDGVYYHHLIDSKTLAPVKNNLASVSVVSKSGIQTDLYSTALFVMGLTDGLRFANEQGIDAVFITDQNEIVLTDGFGYGFTKK